MPENADENTKNFLGERYGDLNQKIQKQLQFFQKRNIAVQIEWECQFLRENQLNEEDKVPMDRLIPRQALR